MGNESSEATFTFIDERRWRSLLRDIHAGQVLPVVGPELLTISGEGGERLLLNQHLARELAARLEVELPADQYLALNSVACAWLLTGGSSVDIYDELRDLVDELNVPPSPALLDLASITDFGLYIATTFDPMLSRALQQVRPGFLPDCNCGDFHPNNPRDLPSPESMPTPYLYHILGTHDTYPDFVVWEEDYIEYVCGLLRAQDNMRMLFDQMRNKDLLLIGSPFNDWLVRLFLRVAKSKRLFEPRDQGRQDYVAEDPARIASPTIFFFERQVGSTRIFPGDPCKFVVELAHRWRERYGATRQEDFLQRMSDELPQGSVFVSYSRDDQDAAVSLASSLAEAQVPVWLDRKRLTAGENFERSLEHAVKNDASFFISLISQATEADEERFVHRERAWAAQRHVDGFVFCLPVLIEDLEEVKQEPEVFSNIHRELLPGGLVTPDFIRRMQALISEYRASGRPRG